MAKRRRGQDEFRDFVLDQLRDLGPVTYRAMFGGHGLYHGGVFFACLYRSQLFLKTDDQMRGKFESRGMGPFRPRPGQTLRSYYEVPAEVLEDAAELAGWARQAVNAAAKKPGKK